MPTIDQPTPAPTRKVAAMTTSGAAAAVLAWLLQALTAVEVPPGIEGAWAVLIAAAAGYLTRERTNTLR